MTHYYNQRDQHANGRRILAISAAGGHFKQLVRLVPRIPGVGSVTWLTYDSGLSTDLLRAAGYGDDRLVYAPYAAPRDLPNLARNAAVAQGLLSEEPYDLAVSTGAGIAVATLPLARVRGVHACYIESAARTLGPSLSGRILRRTPGIDLVTQNKGYPRGWRYVGSVHDEFERGPDRQVYQKVRKVVVTLGTSEAYGFLRLIKRLIEFLPPTVKVLWQTGMTDAEGLGIDARARIPGPELETAIQEADAVIAHAGVGSALTAFELGVFPILVPRRHAFGENIDDHQEVTASDLATRGLALSIEADELSMGHLETVAQRSIVQRAAPPLLDI